MERANRPAQAKTQLADPRRADSSLDRDHRMAVALEETGEGGGSSRRSQRSCCKS